MHRLQSKVALLLFCHAKQRYQVPDSVGLRNMDFIEAFNHRHAVPCADAYYHDNMTRKVSLQTSQNV